MRWTLVVCCLTSLALPVRSAPVLPEEPLVERVREAIQKAIRYLRAEERGRGSWDGTPGASGGPGGVTSLALLALLNGGVKADDPMIQRGLEYLRKIEPEETYAVGLSTMVFAEVGDPRDMPRIQGNVDWLLKTRVLSSGGMKLDGWSYGTPSLSPDFSNSQYALLGLHAGRQAGARVNRSVWEQIERCYEDMQTPGGGWSYKGKSEKDARLTMTVAGFCSLHIAGLELNPFRRNVGPDGIDPKCGIYPENDAIAKALKWLGGGSDDGRTRLRFNSKNMFYNTYGIERAGRLSGMRFLVGHDWYREGCRFLIEHQKQMEDGSWRGWDHGETSTVVCTSFALLFLSKGRTPVLLSKFAHGPGDGWNNKHNDARYLTEYASRELFRRQPLAWQTFDVRKSDLTNREDYLTTVGELLQSPVVYMNGHESPRLTDVQKKLLRQYVDEGGFLFAEACCGSKDFANGFRALVKEIFPDSPLKRLPPEHPVWTAHAAVPPTFAELEGVEQGCKTVVVFSPTPLAGFWEINQSKEGRGRDAFRLAGNVIAYATGLELPPARLTEQKVFDVREERRTPRGFLKVAQIRHQGDWQPAPRAMQNLMKSLRAEAKLDADLKTEEMGLSDPSLFNYKFLYMHGRNRFEFPANELENLRANLKAGGLLFADACCGKREFDVAFRSFAAKLFRDAKLEAIPPNDDLYSAEINGRAITTVRVRREKPGGDGVEAEFRDQPPYLEGIKVDGRWVVIYSKYDIGCALENHASSDCKGHDRASAYKLGTAAVLYSLKR
ncbi:MAG: DUF4159 domain-containing protein [Gemmataceae bacterium]